MRRGLCAVSGVAVAVPAALMRLAPPHMVTLQWHLALHPTVATDTATAAMDAVEASIGVLAWVLAGWLAAIVGTALVGTFPGRLGGNALALAEAITPMLLRGLLGTGLGVGLLGGLGTAPATVAFSTAGVVTAAIPVPAAAMRTAEARCPGTINDLAPSLDWPAPGWCPTQVALTTSQLVSSPAPGTADSPSHIPYQVHPGDSLWSIAQSRLGPDPSSAAVAASWPQWWTANRAVIGADPDLLRPGTVLTPPT